MTKTTVTGGDDKLKAEMKLRSSDNLISGSESELYVSRSEVDNMILTQVNVEKERAMTAETNTQSQVTTLNTQVSEQGVNLRDN